MGLRSQELKQRLKTGRTTFGAWLTISSPAVAEIMAGAGFDWILIDRADLHKQVDSARYEGLPLGCPRTVLVRGELVFRKEGYVGQPEAWPCPTSGQP